MPAKKTNRWVKTVTTDSTHPPEGLFTKSAATIAKTLATKKVSPKVTSVGDADADLLHQPCRAQFERRAPGGAGESKIVAFEARGETQGGKQAANCRLKPILLFAEPPPLVGFAEVAG